MGLIFAKYHVQNIANPVIEQQLDIIIALLDSKLCADLTDIIVGFVGNGDFDFMFEDAIKLVNSATQQTCFNIVEIYDDYIYFYCCCASDDEQMFPCRFKWTCDGFSTTLDMQKAQGREPVFFVDFNCESQIVNLSQTKRFTIRIVTSGETTHYIIHDDEDLGSRFNKLFPLRFHPHEKLLT